MASAQSNAGIEETIAPYAGAFLDNCLRISIIAFVLYDWILTLSREVQIFWAAKTRSLSALLYFSNKYMSVLSQIMDAVELVPVATSNQNCTGVAMMVRMISLLSTIPPAVFTASRTYALTRHRGLSVLTFLLSSISFATNMLFQVVVRFHIPSIYFIPVLGCSADDVVPPSLVRIVTIVNRMSSILADAMLAIITWRLLPDTGIVGQKLRGETPKTKGLASIMVYNGMTYFVVLLTLNILHLGFSGYRTDLVGEHALTFLSSCGSPITSILVSHFLLDLQEAHQKTAVGLTTDDLPLTLSFQVDNCSSDVVDTFGSLGTIIDPADWDDDHDDDAADYPLAVLNSNGPPSPSEGEATD